jgi:hypothetical protein
VDGEEEEEEEEEGMSPEEQFGAPKEAEGQWASCIQMVDAKGCEVCVLPCSAALTHPPRMASPTPAAASRIDPPPVFSHQRPCPQVLSTLELDGNEAALTTCTVTFAKLPGVILVAVATVANLSFYPREATGGFIHLYQVRPCLCPPFPLQL